MSGQSKADICLYRKVRKQSEVLEDKADFPTFRGDMHRFSFYRSSIDLNASFMRTIQTCD
tara:strand:- start:117 stop:296 length:180 start_codon:yes stop_codon:yes gene_type:complete